MRIAFNEHFKKSLSRIRDQLINHYALDDSQAQKIAVDIAKVELTFLVLQELKPEDTFVKSIPFLFYSPKIPSLVTTPDKTMLIQKLQVLYGSRWKINKNIEQKIEGYLSFQSRYGKVNYHVEIFSNEKFRWIKYAYEDRTQLYLEELAKPIQLQKSKPMFVKEEEVTFKDNLLKYKVRIPNYMKSPVHKPIRFHSRNSGEELRLYKKDFVEAAMEMDAIRKRKGLLSQNWQNRIEEIDFLHPKRNLEPTQELIIRGTQQIVGPLSVGKTTLMQIAAFLMKERKKVTTLIVKDVVEVLNLVDNFHDIDVKAVPLISSNQRKTHISQYLASISSEEREQGLATFNRHAFRYLGKSCLIQAQRNEEHISDMKPPCFQLDEKGKNKTCPYITQCEYHQAFRDMEDADVIVTTIQSLMSIKLPAAFFKYPMTALEFIVKHTNLIMVDEADRVQHMLDDLMIPNEKIGSNQSSWLTEIQERVQSVLRESPNLWSTRRKITWLTNLNSAISCEQLIRGYLEDDETSVGINKVIGSQMFTGWKLLHVIARRLAGMNKKEITKENKETYNIIWQDFYRFYEDYKESNYGEGGNDHPLLDAVDVMDDEIRRKKVESYVHRLQEKYGTTISNISEVVNGIVFSLLVCSLEKKLSILTQTYAEVEDVLDIQGKEKTTLFKGIKKDFEGILPISPTGIQFGFKYASNEQQRGNGELLLFRYLAVGRYVLTHMNELYSNIDGKPGAHTILLSGTSYAKGSDRYHVQLPISYVMVNRKQPSPVITYKFHPIFNKKTQAWVKISGKTGNQREEALKTVVYSLMKKKYIHQLLDTLDDGRKRIMIVVGSYKEAGMVASQIRDSHQFRDDEVFALTNDFDSDSYDQTFHYERQLLNAFAEGNGKILVVPLLAVERGHNILTLVDGKKVAAFGAAIYLVRPYPVPNDISGLANWLNALSIRDYLNPRNKKATLYDEMNVLRRKAYQKQFEYFQTSYGYRGLSDNERTNVIMETNTVCHQLEGRLIRGGVPATVVYCDVSFAPLTAEGKIETENTSTLIGWKNHLHHLVSQRNETEAKIAEILYGTRVRGLNNLEVEYE